jgi:hypothetical protein
MTAVKQTSALRQKSVTNRISVEEPDQSFGRRLADGFAPIEAFRQISDDENAQRADEGARNANGQNSGNGE